MASRCRIELLGGLKVVQDHRVITRFRTHKTGALLAYLAFHPRRAHLRDLLTEILWPEDDPDAARLKLRTALSSLRRQLEPPGVPAGAMIMATRTSVQLNAVACVTDVAEFETAVEGADRAGSDVERSEFLSRVVELYQGELLPGYYEEWVLRERERLADGFFRAVLQSAAGLERSGHLARALDTVRRAVALDPLREEVQQELIRLLVAAGQPDAALRQYRELARLLDQELGEAPSAQTRGLIRGIADGTTGSRGGRPNESASALPPAHPLTPGAGRRPPPVSVLPTGTVTFLLAEIDGRPARPEGAWPAEVVLREFHALIRPLVRGHGGHEVQADGQAVYAAFGRATDALAAAVAGQRAVLARAMPLRLRMALHTGEVAPGEEVSRSLSFQHAAHLLLAAHPGQILLSEKGAALLKGELDTDLHLADLGLFRLHREARPERIYQARYPEIAAHLFPPPNAFLAYQGHLPVQLTRFFGRESELDQLREILLAERVRLVTLTGPGGSGKTRLALEAASRLLEPFDNAVWFVSLAEMHQAGRIIDVILDALGLPRSPQRDPLDQLVEMLSRQPALLLLDNFEHLLKNGPPIVRTVLERVPSLTCLVTSRQPLSLSGEREFRVPPLPTPQSGDPPERLQSCESVQLFVDRAQVVRADFQMTRRIAPDVSELCRRLEGIPLALELAAARARVLTMSQMVAQLDRRLDFLVSRKRDLAPRHQTLRAAIDWSYQLLSPELRQFFARLSVFRGGWTLAAAAAVCPDPEDERLALGAWRLAGEGPILTKSQEPRAKSRSEATALDCLEELEQCSLVVAEERGGEVRYRLLESLRAFATEQLELEAGLSPAAARRHALYFLDLAERAAPELRGPDQVAWLDRLKQDEENLRAALDWAAAAGEAEAGLRLAGALRWFWFARGNWSEARERLARLLSLPGAAARTAARARALSVAGGLASLEQDWTAVSSLLQESLSIYRDLDDRAGIAWSLQSLGEAAFHQGDREAARSLAEESLAIWRAMDDRWGMAHALHYLGRMADSRCDYAAARARYAESLAIFRELQDKRGIAWSLNNLGQVVQRQGDLDEARSLHEEALALTLEFDDRAGIAWAQVNLGHIARARGDRDAARWLFTEALALCRALGDHHRLPWHLLDLGRVTLDEGDLAAARGLLDQCLATFRVLKDREGIAHARLTLGHVLRGQGDGEAARVAYREALTLFLELQDRWAITLAVEALAGLAADDRQAGAQAERAARLFGAAEALRDALGAPRPPADRDAYERDVAAARAALGDAAFAAAWAAGRALTLEDAVATALQ